MPPPTDAPTPTTQQPTSAPDFSSIQGHQIHDDSTISAAPPDQLPITGVDPGSIAMELGPVLDHITSKIENYTQEGRELHPVLSRLGDATRAAKELLVGGTTPMGPQEGLANNPVTGILAAAEDAPEIGAAIESGAKKAADYVADTSAFDANPEAGKINFGSVPGHQEHTVNITQEGPAWDRVHRMDVNGQRAGSIGYKTDPQGTAQIYGSHVPESMRGQGIGQQGYKSVIEEAKASGAKKITSDPTNVSEDASRVWQKLKDKGEYPVEEITHPNGKPGYQINFQKTEKPTPKEIIEGAGLKYKGELTPGSHVHMFKHPEHPGKTAAMNEAENITPESVKEKIASKLKDFGVKPSTNPAGAGSMVGKALAQ